MIRFLKSILKGIIDVEARSAGRVAENFLRSQHPDLLVHGTQLRAKEPERIVLAVFYDEPHVWSRPPRYPLVAVDRRSRDASHLETSPESPYWIHGRK
mgnify:CR=1 FL=1